MVGFPVVTTLSPIALEDVEERPRARAQHGRAQSAVLSTAALLASTTIGSARSLVEGEGITSFEGIGTDVENSCQQ